MNINVPIPDKNYKVLVRCITYNHSKYICDALNGFAIQETDFPFICMVVDDASTDGNQEVIRQYANDNCDMSKAEISEDDISKYIRVPHKTNVNCAFLFCLLKVNLYGKPEKQEIYKPYRAVCEYEALCEGDDYWIHPHKLQVQSNWLDTHPNYSMCHGDYIPYNRDVDRKKPALGILYKKQNSRLYDNPKDRFMAIINGYYHILTLTAFFRIECINGYLNSISEEEKNMKFMMGDGQLYLYSSQIGHIKYFSEIFAVYNQHLGSASRNPLTKGLFTMSCHEMNIFYCQKYGYEIPKSLQEKYNNAYIDLLLNSPKEYNFKYPPFKLGIINDFIISKLSENSKFAKSYRKIIPFIYIYRNMKLKIRMVKRMILNAI